MISTSPTSFPTALFRKQVRLLACAKTLSKSKNSGVVNKETRKTDFSSCGTDAKSLGAKRQMRRTMGRKMRAGALERLQGTQAGLARSDSQYEDYQNSLPGYLQETGRFKIRKVKSDIIEKVDEESSLEEGGSRAPNLVNEVEKEHKI